MQLISLTSSIMMIVSIAIKERRKSDREALLNMEKYEASNLILADIKDVK